MRCSRVGRPLASRLEIKALFYPLQLKPGSSNILEPLLTAAPPYHIPVGVAIWILYNYPEDLPLYHHHHKQTGMQHEKNYEYSTLQFTESQECDEE